MGRTKKQDRKKGGHSADAMKKAIELVQGGMSIRKASKECQLSYPTVRLYVKKTNENASQTIRLTPNYEVNKVFTSEEEYELVKYIEHCAELFYGLSTKDCRRIAYQMANVNKHKIPQSWMHTEMAGIEWLRSFRKRHPQISLRKPEACSLARATAFNKYNVDSFFRNLKSAMERHPTFADGTRLYNLDETSTTTVQRPGKVLARKGTNVAKVTSGERGTLVTTCCIVSAIGQAIPPAMVFPRKNFKPHMLHGAPQGTLGLAAPTGWMNADIFVDVMGHFIKHVSASKENPALLLMDNHESHLSIEALNLAKSSGVTVLTLHPHTTAKLQPLDVGLNGPFKTFYNAAVDSWLLRNPGQSLTIYNVAECVGTAYLKAMTPVNIVNAFKKCGIFPFDDSCFTEADFLPSSVTDRPHTTPSNVEEDPEQSENIAPSVNDSHSIDLLLNSTNQDVLAPLTSDLDPNTAKDQNNIEQIPFHLLKSCNEPILSLGPWKNSKPILSTNKKIISPMDFLPPVKSKPRTMKRRRVLGKSMIATDTPEKDEIAKKKANKKQVDKIKQHLFTTGVKNIGKYSSKYKKIIQDKNSDTSDEDEFIASGSSSGGEEFVGENENGDDELLIDGNFLPILREPKVDEFVLVVFHLKKTDIYYVAKVLEKINDDEDDSDYFVSFLRLKNRMRQTFCEPVVPDKTCIQLRDIKYILPDPKIIGSSRRQTSFSFNVHFDMLQLNLR